MHVGLQITGLESLLAKERTVGAKTEGILTEHLMNVGELVAEGTRTRYLDYSIPGAYGVRTVVFTSGLWVAQSLRKSRDPRLRRPNFGPLMMRKSFLPAAYENKARVELAAYLAVEEAKRLYWDI